ncbi:MAG: hypothetical protein ACYSUC_02315 [Planctomycetota bacterium]|jgi:hypothetical protein
MNKRQLITIWVGIIAIVLPWAYETCTGAFHLFSAHSRDWRILVAWTIIATYVTAGLIATFSDKGASNPKGDRD